MNYYICYVEDHPEIGQDISTYLQSQWHRVDWFTDGQKALSEVSKKQYDVLILDIMLPEVDGYDIATYIKQKNKNTPIIMTTAKWMIDDKQQWYDIWIDDYLVKPFSLKELTMRLEAVMKRYIPSEIYRYGDVEVYLEENVVKKNGELVHITTKEWVLLFTLIENTGTVISRLSLTELIWWNDAWWDNKVENKLDVYIASLRRKLWVDCIETIKGMGYKMMKSE